MKNMCRYRIRFLCLLVVCVSLEADQLELKNGDRLSGTILSMQDNIVRMKTSYGIVEVPREDIFLGSFEAGSGRKDEETSSATREKATPVINLPRKGLVFEYLFNGNLSDSSGNEHTLTPHGQVLYSGGQDGIAGRAVLSYGSGAYLSLAKTPVLDALDSFTFSCWVYIQGEGGSQYLISKWESTSGQSARGKFALSYAQEQLYFYVVDREGAYHCLKLPGDLGVKTWHHVAAAFGAGKLILYLDGEALGSRQTDATGLFVSSTPLYLLTAKSFNSETWAFYNLHGRMDNARFYDRVLSSDEIRSLAVEGLSEE